MKNFYTALWMLVILLLSFITNAQQATTKNINNLPDKKKLLELLQSSLDEVFKLTNGLTEAQYVKVPKDSTWSASQIVEHLSQIEDGFLREYFVALNIPPLSNQSNIFYATDSAMLAYETTPEKTKARGTNLPLNRYCSKADALRILKLNRTETMNVITNEPRDLTKIYSYRAKTNQVYEAKNMYQHFLLLIAHMKRHTHQLQKVVGGL